MKKNYYIKTNKDVSSAFRSIYSLEEVESYRPSKQNNCLAE
ncbi:hypothetical protein ABW365_07230 [Enterococcus avium]|nr:hypothetical protein [Enterococcus avium]